MKKIVTLAVLALFGLIICPNFINAKTTFTTADIAVVDNVDEIASKSVLSYETTLQPEAKSSACGYYTFTLKSASYVVTDIAIEENAGVVYPIYDMQIYSNEALTNSVQSLSVSKAKGRNEVLLAKGTYYVKVKETAQSKACNTTFRFSVSAVPVTKLLSASVKVNTTKTAATITVSEGLKSTLRTIQYQYGAVSAANRYQSNYWKTMLLRDYESSGTSSATMLGDGVKKFTVKKNGTYTIRIDNDYTNKYVAYSIQVKVTGLDKTAPTVTGVKNGKTYTKAVTIKFSDKGTGIKTAKLNGTTIKTGKKVSKKGSYTLVVTDKAGNKKTVKFKIK